MRRTILTFIGIAALALVTASCAPAKHSGPVAYTYSAVTAADGIAIDASGYIWVLGQAGDLAELAANGSLIGAKTLAPCTDGSGNSITAYYGIAIDAYGSIWAVNYACDFVDQLTPSTNSEQQFITGAAPYGIAIDGTGNVWVGDNGPGTTSYSSVTEVEVKQTYSYSASSTPLSSNCAESVAIDASGYVWLSGCGYVYLIDSANGTPSGGQYDFVNTNNPSPGSIAIDRHNDAWVTDVDSIYLLSPPNDPVLMYSASGADLKGIAIDRAGDVWVTDAATSTLLKLSPSGVLLAAFAVGNGPGGVAIDAYGDVWVANTTDGTVTEWVGIAAGPQYFPYSGPQFPGGQP
ncbi:MAG: hypothetical protein M1517_09585 [Deltaproteobacteria bacterium]|nr:hypothetical protein [Deltaproteobacteria bacterium]